MADIAYDQSINQVILDLYNDVNQNDSGTMEWTQVFGLNEVKTITDTRTVFDEEDLQMQEWMKKLHNETVKWYCMWPNINVIISYMYYHAKKIAINCERDHSVWDEWKWII